MCAVLAPLRRVNTYIKKDICFAGVQASQHALRRSVLSVLRLGLEQRAPLDGGLEGGEGVARRAVQVGVLVDELEHERALGMRRAHRREK